MRSSFPVALLGGLLAAAPPAESQAPQTPEVVIPVGTEVVRIDVIVTEKGGKAIPGLKRDDFQVLEDGQPQPISSFEAFVALAAPAASATQAAASTRPAGETAAVASRLPIPRRFVVLAVDDIHIEAANLMRLKKTLDRFLEREIPREDTVALVTTSGQHSHDLTDDRHTLRQVVARLSPQERRLRQIDVPYITDYQAELIERGDREALQVAVDEILARRRSPNAEAEARGVARAVVAESINNSRITFETLSNVVRGMGGLPGRKMVVLVSDGFTSGFGVEAGAMFDLRRITDAGTRSGVIVYALDSRGLQANASFGAPNRGPVLTQGGLGNIGIKERLEIAGDFAAQDAMNAMAADTGGFLVADTNNFSGALRKILQDSEVYYVLAYEPTSTKRDGAFRKIEVRLPGLKNARLRHRKGYFGPVPEGRAAGAGGAGPAPTAPSPMDALRAELRTALSSTDPVADLPVRMSADFVSSSGGVAQVVIHGHVDLHEVPFARTDDKRLATVDIAAAIFDDSGVAVGSLPVERAALDFTSTAYERALEQGLSYQRTAPLGPGRYRVSVAVREAGGKMGKAMQWVEIPDLGRGEMTLSSLFLMKEAPDSQQNTISAGPGLRAVQAQRTYRRDESLYVQFFVYNVAQTATNLVTQTEIWRNGAMLAASRPEPFEAQWGAASPVAYTRKIKLRPFETGEYEVRVVVKNPVSGLSASRRSGFRID